MAADKSHKSEGRYTLIFRRTIRHPKTGKIIRPKNGAKAFPIKIPADSLSTISLPDTEPENSEIAKESTEQVN
jgi:hypothetical protein